MSPAYSVRRSVLDHLSFCCSHLPRYWQSLLKRKKKKKNQYILHPLQPLGVKVVDSVATTWVSIPTPRLPNCEMFLSMAHLKSLISKGDETKLFFKVTVDIFQLSRSYRTLLGALGEMEVFSRNVLTIGEIPRKTLGPTDRHAEVPTAGLPRKKAVLGTWDSGRT